MMSDTWLTDALDTVGWNVGKSGKTIRVLDHIDNHRLVTITFLTVRKREATAHILHGIDGGVEFWIRVKSTLTDVVSAVRWLKPRAIMHAESKGAPVSRQGDWFFVARPHFVPGEIRNRISYGRHVFDQWSEGHVRGWVVHAQHASMFLDGWHLPVRCRGWHTLGVPRPVHTQQYWVHQLKGGERVCS
jgi:hypothetical protein